MSLILKIQERVSMELSVESEDEDVQNERNRILEYPQESLNSTVLIKELAKVTLFNEKLRMVSFLLKCMSLVSRTHCGFWHLCVFSQ